MAIHRKKGFTWGSLLTLLRACLKYIFIDGKLFKHPHNQFCLAKVLEFKLENLQAWLALLFHEIGLGTCYSVIYKESLSQSQQYNMLSLNCWITINDEALNELHFWNDLPILRSESDIRPSSSGLSI